ncbi:MAG: hypothetical protein DRP15_00205 [Candidatus Aenigmatarchaeota archaeon]|nr:MAG: hypothetical protein DRP15_00205 [Candidatus Aenigmarchaeota archaeon]
MKGVSPLISMIILIGIAIAIGAMLSPWITRLITSGMNEASNQTHTEIKCQNLAYDFDSSYGVNGAEWDFSGSNDWLRVKIVNTGTINVYGFSFEILLDSGTPVIKHFVATSSTQRTESKPLRPGQSYIIEANITEDLTGTIKEIKILNAVCPEIYATIRF